MPSPGAQPVPDYDALDLGRDANGRWLIGTKYSDGSYVVWDANTEEEVAYIHAGRTDPADIGGGRAAVINPDGSLTAFDIANPPPELQGAPPPQSPGAAPPNPNAPTGEIGTRRPGEDFNYGPTRPGAGRYPAGFGTTVSAATRNPAMPSQGRRAGWGSIGAGTENIPYGWGAPGFGQNPIRIREDYLDNLFDPAQAPGYIPGSGTYNQFRLSEGGLFGTLPGTTGEVNLRYGLGGTGDPTTGFEVQTPERYITGQAGASRVAQQGDEYARGVRPLPPGRGGGGGGWDQAWAAAAPRYAPPADPYGTGGGGGMGGGFFTAGPGYSPAELGHDWDEAPQTQGLDSLVTLFMRSDTPTGVSTAAYSAPPQFRNLLVDAIRRGIIVVNDPMAWEMLREWGYTPQTIGGAALTGRSGATASGAGGSSTEDAIANGNAAEAADRAAYWAYQQSLLRQGDQRIALEEARDAWAKAYQTAGLTGQFDGQDTMAMQQQRFGQGVTQAGLTGQYNGAPTVQEQQRLYEQGVTNAGLLGTYQGQDTLAKIAQQNQAALGLLGLQAQLQGPRNWARYQSTFGATPQGLQDVMGAFQGRYQLPTGQGAQNTAQGGRQSVSGLAGDILSGTYGNDTQSGGLAAMGNPRQADLQNWARMQPSQREMILGQYEDQGWYGPDVENLLKGAAPRAAGPSGASYNFFQR